MDHGEIRCTSAHRLIICWSGGILWKRVLKLRVFFLTGWTNTNFKNPYHLLRPSHIFWYLVVRQSKEYHGPGAPFYPVLGEEFGFHVQFAELETCSYEVHRPFLYKMKTNTENLESEENGGMWREKPSGLLALVGHRPPCSPAGTKTTCAHNFEANSSVIVFISRQQLILHLDNVHCRRFIWICTHVTHKNLKWNKRENEGHERRRKWKKDIE
jgi:hypothetical protein